MIGSTRSSTNARTLSRTARSSSERSESMLKKSSMARNLRRRPSDRALGRRFDPDLARLGAESTPVVERKAGFVLPLVHHLVQQRVERFVPTVAAQVSPGDRDLGAFAVLGR